MLTDRSRVERTVDKGGVTDNHVNSGAGTTVKRYNLALPGELYDQIQLLAERKHTTVLDLLRRFIKLGLLAAKLDDDPDAALIIRQGNTEREIVLV